MLELLWLDSGLAVYIVCFAIALKRQVHMLQLSSYRNERYILWVKQNKMGEASPVEAFLPLVAAVIMQGVDARFSLGFAAASALMLFLLKKHKEKKPLVFTARVKRLYLTAALCAAAFVAVADILLFTTAGQSRFFLFLWVFAGACLYPFRFVFMLFVNMLNAPLEKAIQKGYIKDAARILKQSQNLETVGITGSFGKTTTKHILTRMLSEKYDVLMTPESFNTPMGVVRTVRENLKPTHRFFVCEMGAKQRGDIREICDIVNPKHCIITSVGNCHLESFKTIENVCDTKFELFDAARGVRVLNYDSAPVRAREKQGGFVTYGTTDDCDYYAENIAYSNGRMTFVLHLKNGEAVDITTSLLGKTNALDITGAAAMAFELGVGKSEIAYAAARLSPVAHRLEIRRAGDYIVIDDAYNSNPDGAKEALSVLSTFSGYRRVLITPGIVELGTDEARCNEELGRHAAACADTVIGVSHIAPHIENGLKAAGFDMSNYFYAENLKAALKLLDEIGKSGTAVLFENDLPDNMENV